MHDIQLIDAPARISLICVLRLRLALRILIQLLADLINGSSMRSISSDLPWCRAEGTPSHIQPS